MATSNDLKNGMVLNIDGGGGELSEEGKPLIYTLNGAEKTYADFRLTVTNPGGHSIAPRSDNAINELAAALFRIGNYRFTPQLNDVTRAYFIGAADHERPEIAAAMRAFPMDEAPWLHVSSTSVYGQEDGSWVDEDAPCQPTDTNGEIVLEAEQTLRRQRPDASILRFAGIYGPGRLMRTASLLAGEPMRGDPDRWLNLIHRDDGARVLAFSSLMRTTS